MTQELRGFSHIPEGQLVKSEEEPAQLKDYLARIHPFPVFMGCVDTDPTADKFANMNWLLGQSRAPVTVEPILPSEFVYLDNHNDSVGALWGRHHDMFGEFIAKYATGSQVYEIGGAHGLASLAANRFRNLSWTIHDINPCPYPAYEGAIVKGAFSITSASLSRLCSTIAHSHTLEHVHDPSSFFGEIAQVLPIGGRQIFSWPNMRKMLERCDLNFLNFEHTAYLPETVVMEMLERNGFALVGVNNFQDHSIFVAAEKVKNVQNPVNRGHSLEDRELFTKYFQALDRKVTHFNSALKAHKGPCYVFGAHVFTQMLIAGGLQADFLSGCLDNSPAKSGKRLYGTNLITSKPTEHTFKSRVGDVLVVMSVAQYADEIEEGLKNLGGSKCVVLT